MLIQFAVCTYMNLCYPDNKIERIRKELDLLPKGKYSE